MILPSEYKLLTELNKFSWLTALTQTCQMAKDKRANMYTNRADALGVRSWFKKVLMMSAEERSDRDKTALRATPFNRKQQWGELRKQQKSKTS